MIRYHISNKMFRFQVFLTLIRHKNELKTDSKQHPNMKFYMLIKKIKDYVSQL